MLCESLLEVAPSEGLIPRIAGRCGGILHFLAEVLEARQGGLVRDVLLLHGRRRCRARAA